MIQESRTYIATPPGTEIKEQLDYRGMTQKELAARMDMSEKHISRLINGEVILTPETAVKLEIVFGVPASFWNRYEALYRETLIKVDEENSIDEDADIAKKFPYSEMASYGWVPETRKLQEKVINLRKFFGVVNLSLLDNEQIMCIACRRLAVSDRSDLALMAWAQEARIQSENISVSSLNLKKLMTDLDVIRKMTTEEPKDFCPKLKKELADCGIALIFLPHLKGSFLQVATFRNGKKIVIGMTTRGKDSDKFWFSLFHELGHVVLGHVGKKGGTTEADEKSADQWAENILISPDAMRQFIAKNDFSKSSVIRFAEEEGITPGIVVGRLQQEKCIPYNRLNQLKTRYEIKRD